MTLVDFILGAILVTIGCVVVFAFFFFLYLIVRDSLDDYR